MKPSPFDLTNKVAIVTGSARGIGRAIAQGLASVGVKIVIADIKGLEAEKTAQKIQVDGGEAIAIPTDVRNRQECLQLIEQTVAHYHRLDIMVCNAGIDILKSANSLEESEWDNIINVNLKGYFHCAQQAAIQMIAQGTGGSIIMNSSIGGVVGISGSAAYTASKGGVNLLVRSLALEWADHQIRVNAFAPGYIDNIMEGTETFRRSPEEDQQHLNAVIPMKRRGKPEELVGPVLFLASEAASYVTGTILMVDGGYSAM
ncbi:SDR family NAD(P)-dependent oxidoreductase [Nodularia sphaerocarpa]|uniref:SDR family NAD(P)-dependent oxidoreductase n=1 Tax=Nodularia sphaerocarpa TaxID=137816 RepID=UPI001EFB16D9|nr:SDR family NAD(P)-dependent oxidoreductase [Nodularia sphaerocarpa]MDB9373587.1 SDR family NAD(P)-dependent oxidoreductase [Nodularia sphaerocarpa CS-585]MDB9378028.1 SDR family NAD(P)-dependent oxidoreductase [Nodularia sphaerocarpa CS-585A2]ULP74375.1 oxidoreductase [Nodularia sphaerocarpa UHCC 0038]